MKQHKASELRYKASILDSDGQTVLASGLGAGVMDLSGRSSDQQQLVAQVSTHMILLRWPDAHSVVKATGYVTVTGDPALYVVDEIRDPRKPRPRVWTEVYCHVMRTQS